ncbi:PAS domain-containing sensor histidine kinase [Methylobacterium sp. J-092]|uniref:PAS domain-containing sensor histidine kinase n=1 Tax=Methylobacterium sp. J-092 TaxID=2836667 RepID=UPI001FB8761B|nr:PAS domain-containing sensor histidine kinase [Methylobacterium sp. J-092]MCJ2008559.1 PAS domain-containing sensor histidine kinase [Methylobacterium sp. J-092]
MRIQHRLPALLDARLASFVHESAIEDASVRFRHERFLVSRLATGAVMMAGLPPYLLWRGVPSGIEVLAIASLFLPVLAAVLLSRTGSLWIAHAVSSAGLTGLVVCLASLTGGVQSAAAIWLVAIPLEAVVSGSKRATVAASLLAMVGVLCVAFTGSWIITSPTMALSASVAMPVFAITAIGHVAAQVLEQMRNEGQWRKRMRDNEARDRMLLAAIDDLVTWHDVNGRVIEASASAETLVGTDAMRLRGHGLLERVHVADRPAFLQAISDVAALGKPATVQLRLNVDPTARRQDGARLIHVEMRAHRIAQSPSGPVGVVAVTRDVTEHRRHAEELERARAEAERADEVKSRFLANVTHELRTPLNAIIGFSEVLAGEGAVVLAPERAREYAGIIGASGQHLLSVVNTLLDMSRIQSGNFDYAPELVDAAALTRSCCDLMKLKADAVGVVLAQVAEPGPIEITADSRACRQVLINLISNAVKFTPAGGRVEVALRRTAAGLDLIVSDTGIGIREADLPRLGTPFFQAGSGGYKRTHEGTGLGLSVVQGLVGLHGGMIAIESAPDAGTTVTVSLPRACRSAESPVGTAPLTARVRPAGRASANGAVVRLPLGLFDTGPTVVREIDDPARLRRVG